MAMVFWGTAGVQIDFGPAALDQQVK